MSRENGTTLVRFLVLGLVLAGLVVFALTLTEEPAMATDSDSDGISDDMENALGTDPNDSDSDDDTLSDFTEVFELGTDPLLDNTDGDHLLDAVDPFPLDDGGGGGGMSQADMTFASNLKRSALTGTTPFAGLRVNAITGQLEMRLATIDFGPSYRGRNQLVLTYFSGIEFNGPWGRNVVCNWDWWIEEQQDDDVHVYMFGAKYVVTESSGTYTSPAGFPFTVTKDVQEDEITVTAIKGGKMWVFDATDGWLLEIADQFGNTTEIDRDGTGVIETVTLPEGNEVTIGLGGFGRYLSISDWNDPSRDWLLYYGVTDQLMKIQDAEENQTQFFYINGSQDDDLNHNLVRIITAGGKELVKVEYDASDRVSKQTIEGESATFTYTSTKTSYTDFAGNDKEWNYTAGAIVPNSFVAYSNRDVRAGDPASWTTSFEHNTNHLRTEVVFPEGNRIDFDWDSDYCLTEKRFKTTDTDTDSDTNDLVWDYTYGSTYNQLEDSTDPRGNTTERTLNGDELVTRIDFETITHPDPDVSIYETLTWNSNGQMVTHTDGEGAVTKYEYFTAGTKKGLLKKVIVDQGTGTLNLTTEYGYSDYRYLTSTEDPDENTWTFTTNKHGQRTKSTSPSPMGYEIDFTINADGYLTQKDVENVDEDNVRSTTNPWFTTTYTRDALGRLKTLVEEIDASTTRTTTYTLDGNGNVTLVTLPEGNKVKQVWDERGLLAERTRGYDTSDAATDKWAYDGNQNMTDYTDGRGKVWEKTYDDFDRLTKDETPIGHYTSYVLDKSGNVTEIKGYDSSDTLLAHRKRYFDELSRLYKVEDWLDEEAPTPDRWLAAKIDHDKCHRVVKTTNARNNSTQTAYDAAGRRTQVQDPLGNKIDFGFSGDCCTATEIEEVEIVPGGGSQTFRKEFVLDALNRVIEFRIVDRLDSNNKTVVKYKYSSLGIPVEQIDAKGHKTWLTHDGLGRITKKEVEIASVGETEYGYDKNDNLNSLTDHNGHETEWVHNYRDLINFIEYADGERRTFTWNGVDQPTGYTDENGSVVSITRDDDGHLTSKVITKATGVEGEGSEDYTIDGLGRVTEAKNTFWIVKNTYNTLSWLTAQVQGPNPLGNCGKTIAYTYFDDGSEATIGYPSGYTVDLTTDANQRVTAAENQSQKLFEHKFYGGGYRLRETESLSGTVTTIGYNGFRDVTAIDHEDSLSATLVGLDLGRDVMGQPKYIEFTNRDNKGHVYLYDKAERLISTAVWSDDPSSDAYDGDIGDEVYVQKIDYDLDRVGNRDEVTHTPYGQQGVNTDYTHNSVNAYTQIGSSQRSHDDNGNLTGNSTLDFFYNYRNDLVRVEANSATVASYRFDAYNRRVSRTVNATSATTYFIYDGEHVIEEYDGSWILLRKFVYGQTIDDIQVMIAPDYGDVDMDQNTTEVLNFYYHTDHIGSVLAVTGPNEQIVEQYEYTPYGVTTIKDGQGNDLHGESAILNPFFFTARRFDEETGLYHYRHRAYDAVAGRFHQTDPVVRGRIRHYAYCAASPTDARDPLGLDFIAGGKSYTEDELRSEARRDAEAKFTAETKKIDAKFQRFKILCASLGDKAQVRHQTQAKQTRDGRSNHVYHTRLWIRAEGIPRHSSLGIYGLHTMEVVVARFWHEIKQSHRFACVAGSGSNVRKLRVRIGEDDSIGGSTRTCTPDEIENNDAGHALPRDQVVRQKVVISEDHNVLVRGESRAVYEWARGTGVGESNDDFDGYLPDDPVAGEKVLGNARAPMRKDEIWSPWSPADRNPVTGAPLKWGPPWGMPQKGVNRGGR